MHGIIQGQPSEWSELHHVSDLNHEVSYSIPYEVPMKVSPPKTVTKFVLPSPVKATPSIIITWWEGGHIDDLSDDDELDSHMSEISETGEDGSGNIERENKEGEDFENEGFVKEQRGNYMQGNDVGKGGPQKERVGKDVKVPPKKKAKISPAKLGQ